MPLTIQEEAAFLNRQSCFNHEEFCDGLSVYRKTLALTFGDVPDEAPPNWKQSMIVLLEQLFLNPLLHSLGMAEAIFIGNLISVAALGWVLVPPANRAFDQWLRPMPHGPRWTTAAGVALNHRPLHSICRRVRFSGESRRPEDVSRFSMCTGGVLPTARSWSTGP